MSKYRKLGCNQAGVLEALVRHGHWHYSTYWTWNTRKGTKRLLDQLVQRGAVRVEQVVVQETEYSPSYVREVYLPVHRYR